MAKPIYDPFSWSAPGNTLQDLYNWYLSGGDEATDDTIIGGGGGGGGPAAPITNVFNPDPNTMRLPSSFQRTEGSWQGPGTTGLPGDILQRGPGRQFTGMEADIVGDPRKLDDEDASWFKQFREGVIDNPLMQGVMAVTNPAITALKGLAQKLPVNERAILENQALGSGVALDDIGRVVQQQGLAYDTAENIMAGYNYAQMDEDTFDERIKNLKMKEGPAKKARIKAIKAAKQAWLESKRKADIVTQKQRLDRATDDQKTTIKDFKTGEIGLEDDSSLYTLTESVDQEMGTEHHLDEAKDDLVKSVIAPDYDTEGMVDEYDELYREFPELLYRDLKEKKAKEKDLAKSIAVETGVAELTHPKISLAKQAAINKAKAKAADTDAGAFKKTVQLDPGSGGGGGGSWHQQTAAKERQGEKVSGPGFGKGAYFRDGGLIRKKYGNGGIVDLL